MTEAHFERLYGEYGFYVFRRCRHLLGNDTEAEDAMQEVFLKLLANLDRLDPERPLLPWINRVTTNHCLNRIRKAKYRQSDDSVSVDVLPDDTAAVFQLLLERQHLVARLVASADGQTQEIVAGYFWDELSVETLARDLSVSVPTIRRRIKAFVEGARSELQRLQDRATTAQPVEDT
jgi:RNA polymerase sigma-70 factor (ECF subfamily)